MGQQLYVTKEVMEQNGWERSVQVVQPGYWYDNDNGPSVYVEAIRRVTWTHETHGSITGTYDVPCAGFYMDIAPGGSNFELAMETGLLSIGDIV